MMNRCLLLGLATLFALSATACQSLPVQTADVTYAPTPTQIDGKLDDPVWRSAVRYPLGYSLDRSGDLPTGEYGYVQFAWDAQALYVAVRVVDNDPYTDATADGQHLWELGDIVEWFLWPDKQTRYWELHVTPANKYSAYLCPTGKVLESIVPLPFTGKASACAAGDQCVSAPGWSAEFRMTWADARKLDPTLGPQSSWRCLIGRYNYNHHWPKPELRMWPATSKTNYHMIHQYAKLRLLPGTPPHAESPRP